jgi:hypothetical protein
MIQPGRDIPGISGGDRGQRMIVDGYPPKMGG